MGYWGVWTLARTEDPVDELAVIEEFSDGAETCEQAGDWQVCEFTEEDIYTHAARVLPELVAATSAPALIGFILDSDCLWVAGLVPNENTFHVCVAREATAGYLEDHDRRIDDVFLSPGQAVEAAASWSRAALLEPDRELLGSLFEMQELEIGLEQNIWFALLAGLGVQTGT